MIRFYCPACFARLPSAEAGCPACGCDPAAWSRRHSYRERLIHGLSHPIREVQMAAVISLGNRRDPAAALPLARCALEHSSDIVLALEIVAALRKLRRSPEKEAAAVLLDGHPALAVRKASAALRDR